MEVRIKHYCIIFYCTSAITNKHFCSVLFCLFLKNFVHYLSTFLFCFIQISFHVCLLQAVDLFELRPYQFHFTSIVNVLISTLCTPSPPHTHHLWAIVLVKSGLAGCPLDFSFSICFKPVHPLGISQKFSQPR